MGKACCGDQAAGTYLSARAGVVRLYPRPPSKLVPVSLHGNLDLATLEVLRDERRVVEEAAG